MMPYSLILRLTMSLLIMSALSTSAFAGEVAYTNAMGIRYNPLLLGDELRIGYREKLWNKPSDDLLFGTAHLWGGAHLVLSPAFVSTGLFFAAQPIAVLELDGGLARVLSFMTLGDILDSDLNTRGTKDAAAAAGSAVTDGWSGHFQGRLQAKHGAFAARTTALFRWFDLEGPENGLFYQQGMDVVTGLESWVLQEDSDLLYLSPPGHWVLGLRYSYLHAFSSGTADIHRAGPLFLWKLSNPDPSPAYKDPAIVVLCQWHIAHQWRAGQSMPQSLPYLLVAYTFKGELTKSQR